MTKYYVITDECINDPLICGNREYLEECYPNLTVSELPNDYVSGKYIVSNGVLVLNPNYEEEQAAKREENFKAEFFEISNYGWFRKQPKGYSSAVESLNTAFNAVTILQQLPANMLIFYPEPDFTKPEQCTEEWLVAHQIFNQVMTAQEFGVFYMAFMTAWNTEMHETGEE